MWIYQDAELLLPSKVPLIVSGSFSLTGELALAGMSFPDEGKQVSYTGPKWYSQQY